MMETTFEERVYLTVTGTLENAYCVPGVQDLFADGMPCDRLYKDACAAYERLRQRLDVADEDQDVEVIIDSLLDICHHVGLKMFRQGWGICLESVHEADPVTVNGQLCKPSERK